MVVRGDCDFEFCSAAVGTGADVASGDLILVESVEVGASLLVKDSEGANPAGVVLPAGFDCGEMASGRLEEVWEVVDGSLA